MTQETTQPPTDFFHALANQGQGYEVLADSTALLNLSNELVGSATPKTAVEVAFNIIHPEKAINRREWAKVDWQEQATPDRKRSAANILGTLLLNRAFTDNKEAGVERAVIGLPAFEEEGINTPSLETEELSNRTGLSKERIVFRRYEALTKLAEIWSLESGTNHPINHAEIKAELVPRIFETYGQLGYGLVGALFKNDMTHPFIYLDRVFNGRNPDNPLHSTYSNGIAGYNKHASSGRDAVIKHLETTPFNGSQVLLDSESTDNLEEVKNLQDKLAEISRLYAMSGKKLTGWLEDSASILAIDKTSGFTQVEAFKIAELKMSIKTFEAKGNELQRYETVVTNEENIKNIAEAYRQAGLNLPIGIATIIELLDGKDLAQLSEESGLKPKLVGARIENGLNSLRHLLTQTSDHSRITVDQAKKLIPSQVAAKPKISKPAKPTRPPKTPTVPKPNRVYEPGPEIEGAVSSSDVDALLNIMDTDAAAELTRGVPGSVDGKRRRLATELSKHAASYNEGKYEDIPPKLRSALDILFGKD